MTLQRKIYLAIFSFVILIFLMAVFVFIPLFESIKDNSKELISQRTNLASLETKIKNLNQIKNAYYNFESNLKEVDELFVNPEVPVEFISFLEKISKDSQIKIKISLASSGKTEEDFWPFIIFQLNAEGVSPNLLRFLEKLENAPYLTEIQNITLSHTEKTNMVQATFLLKIYTK